MATLQNKKVVVIGGTSGIGFGVALAALQSQASVVTVASSNAERVAKAVERLQSHKLPGEVRGEVVDAKDPAAIKAFTERIGAVDHIAWSSGDVTAGMLDSSASKENLINSAFNVRFWGPFILAQTAKFNPGGSLTLTSGTLDTKPTPGLAATSGVVASIEGLTKGLAVDLAPAGIRVNLVGPGAVETELWDNFPKEVKGYFEQTVQTKQLIKRIGTPSEIAEAYMFLMKCQYITGERINVNGGVTLA